MVSLNVYKKQSWASTPFHPWHQSSFLNSGGWRRRLPVYPHPLHYTPHGSLGHHQQAEFLSKMTSKLRHFLGQLWRAGLLQTTWGPQGFALPHLIPKPSSALSPSPRSMNIHWVIAYITSILSNTILERSSIKFQSDCENHKSNRTTMWC